MTKTRGRRWAACCRSPAMVRLCDVEISVVVWHWVAVATRGGADCPGWHPPGGWYPTKIIFWPNLERTLDKRPRKSEGGSGEEKKAKKTCKRSPLCRGRWLKTVVSFFFRKKIGWHYQLRPRVTPTLVTPLMGCSELWFGCSLDFFTHIRTYKTQSQIPNTGFCRLETGLAIRRKTNGW